MHWDSYKVRKLVCISLISSRLNKIILFTKFLLLLIDDLWCRTGQFKLYSGGLAWKKQGGGKIIEVDKADITSVTWMRIPKSYQLSVGTREGLCYRFFGFCEQVIFSQLVYSKDLLSIANLKTCWKMNLVLRVNLSYTWYMFQCLFLFQIIETGVYFDSSFISLLCRMLAALLTSYKKARG